MKKLLSALLLVATTAFAADNVVVPPGAGRTYLKDASGNYFPLGVMYTTDGNGNLLTLGGQTLVADNLIVPPGQGQPYLQDSLSRLFPAMVIYTTDGNGIVQPVSVGGGGGGAWGSITGTLSDQTDLQAALDAKQATLGYTAENAANKSTDGTMAANSATLYPSQSAVVTYVAAHAPAVASVFGRIGAVIAQAGDYAAYYISNVLATNSFLIGVGGVATPQTGTQATALLAAYTADTTAAPGTQGVVPAPAAGMTESGQFLTGSGPAYVDQSKPIPQPLNMLSWSPAVAGNQKHQNVLMMQNGNKTYAVVGGGLSTGKTVTIYDVTNQAAPVLRGSILLSGTYGVCGSNASWPYVFVPASGARTLTVLNISNPSAPVVVGTPFSWTANTTSIYGCTYSNGLVFMAGQTRGLGILDVGNGVSGGTITAPVLAYDEGGQSICSVANSCKSFGVAVDPVQQIAYSTDFSTATPWTYRQLKAYSYASSITAPTLLQNLTLPANTKALTVSLNLGTKTAFVQDANQNLIDVVDLTSVSTGGMTNLSTLTPSGVFDSSPAAASVSGSNYVYVPSGSASVQGSLDVFDLTNRSLPVKIATARTNAALTGVSTSVFGGIAIDPRGGYVYVGDYGNGTAGSGLDIFSMPFESGTIGTETVSQLTVKNIVQLPVQASGVTPTCAAAADDGKMAVTNTHKLCLCNGATPGWFDTTGLVACTF